MHRFHPVLAAFLAVLAITANAATSPQVPIEGSAIPRFAQPLPLPSVAPQNGTLTTIAGSRPVTLRMCEFRSNILPPGAVSNYHGTWVWGYLVDPGGNSTCNDLITLYGGANGILDTYTGPVIVNERGSATEVTYVNDLRDTVTSNLLAYRYSTDQTLHWADPLSASPDSNLCTMETEIPSFGSKCAQNYFGPIPAVAHLHGGEVPAEIDGGPDSWFTSDGLHHGYRFYTMKPGAGNRATVRYPNTQEAAPIWFHDHTLGATRLNVYAGLAGAYLIHDTALDLPQNLHPLNEIVPLVLQDRAFDTEGQLFFPANENNGTLYSPNANHPYWVPEFIGDTIVVNGKAWPYLEVEQRRYRFLLLNGSNSRTYQLSISTGDSNRPGPAMWVIGNDGGYLDAAVRVGAGRNRLVRLPGHPPNSGALTIMPGERYEVIVDFAGFPAGSRLVLQNAANAPYPDGDPVDSDTTARILEFRVVNCGTGRCNASDASYNAASGTPLRKGNQKIVRLADPRSGTLAPGVTPALTRELTLNEVLSEGRTVVNPVTGEMTEYEGGPLEVLVNNTEWMGESGRPYDDFTLVSAGGVTTAISEVPEEGTTEVWEIVNLTADAHPIHLHLVQFQILNRQDFDVDAYAENYDNAFPGNAYLQGFGPPKDYRADRNPLSGGKAGGNPDVTPYLLGKARRPLPEESGWKDTAVMYPGQVTRIVVRWAPTDVPVGAPGSALYFPFDPSGEGGRFAYVWHCHIIDHEDNEMMRPDFLVPNALAPAVRPLKKGTDY